MARASGGTRADAVHADLRAEILAGRLAPGARLQFSALCERYGVSVSVVRDALTRLAEQGLARAQPHQGFMVTPLSADDLAELTQARTAIESLVVRLACETGDVAWEASVLAAHHTLERTPEVPPDDPDRIDDAWAASHRAFHEAVLAGCPNQRLRDIAAALREEAELYRRWSRPLGDGRVRDVRAEHRALLGAAISRDGERAAEVITAHINRTTELLEQASTELS